jgi:hypothetical protein
MRPTSWAIGAVLMAVIATGCTTTNQSGTASSDKEYMPPTSIYNILDSTALVYLDPAGSSINDHFLRWVSSYLIHSVMR